MFAIGIIKYIKRDVNDVEKSELHFFIYFLNITFCHLKFLFLLFLLWLLLCGTGKNASFLVSFYFSRKYFNLINNFFVSAYDSFYFFSSQDAVVFRISLMYCDYVYDISIIRSSCHGHGNLNLQIYRIPRVSVFHHSFSLWIFFSLIHIYMSIYIHIINEKLILRT